MEYRVYISLPVGIPHTMFLTHGVYCAIPRKYCGKISMQVFTVDMTDNSVVNILSYDECQKQSNPANSYLWKIANEMRSCLVADSQHIEVKRLDVVVECLVVKEQFRQQTQVLTVDLWPVAVHLEHRQITATVDLITRRTMNITFLLTTHTYINI